jgi:hypothetical protein
MSSLYCTHAGMRSDQSQRFHYIDSQSSCIHSWNASLYLSNFSASTLFTPSQCIFYISFYGSLYIASRHSSTAPIPPLIWLYFRDGILIYDKSIICFWDYIIARIDYTTIESISTNRATYYILVSLFYLIDCRDIHYFRLDYFRVCFIFPSCNVWLQFYLMMFYF